MKYRKYFCDTITYALIVLFTYAAIVKLIDVQKFEIDLGKSPLVTQWATSIAWLMPFCELLISIMLLSPVTLLAALYASYFLLIMFASYIVAITQFSSYIPCSCGGILESMTWNQHLIFNLCFACATLVSIILQSTHSRNA